MRNEHAYAQIQFYATASYPCSYLDERQARAQVAGPVRLIDGELYSELVRQGFRRSGLFTYRPSCDNCRACVPVRIDIARFVANRSQRRAWQRHAGLCAHERPLQFSEEHYQLYQRYQSARHRGGGMDQDDHEQYERFLLESSVDTRLIEFRDEEALRMVSIVDCLDDGLSSVYTFFDAELAQAALGTFSILWQIEACRRLQLPFLYLGYWIGQSEKMAYKSRFQPLQALHGDQWLEFDQLPASRGGNQPDPVEGGKIPSPRGC